MFNQRKTAIERFKNLDLAAIEDIQDDKLRKRALHLKKKQGGFTLLELLVVVAILAVIGGAMISSFGGQEAKAGRGVATQSIAGIEDAMRIYTAVNGVLPNNLESLTCLDFTLTAHPTTITNSFPPATWTTGTDETSKFGGEFDLPGVGGGMGKKIAGKFDLVSLPADMGQALIDGGITSLRYAHGESCDADAATPATALVAQNGADFPAAALADIDIPTHAFEDPRPGTNRNRGRGFARDINFGGATTPALMVWDRGTNGYNNVKIGAAADDVLIGLGMGQASTAVGDDDAPFAKAPFYAGQLGKDKYSHYTLLVKVGTDTDGDLTTTTDQSAAEKATIKAVVDARGDFLDEEIAEFNGQKS